MFLILVEFSGTGIFFGFGVSDGVLSAGPVVFCCSLLFCAGAMLEGVGGVVSSEEFSVVRIFVGRLVFFDAVVSLFGLRWLRLLVFTVVSDWDIALVVVELLHEMS